MQIFSSKYVLIFFSLITIIIFLKIFFDYYLSDFLILVKKSINKFSHYSKSRFLNSDIYQEYINKKIEKNLPTFLDALSSSIQSGMNLNKSFEFLAAELDFPLSHFAKEISNKMNLNIQFEESLRPLEKKFKSDEILLFLNSLKVQSKYGGKLTDILQNIASSIRDREKIRRDINSFTSQGKMSAMIMVLLGPIALFIFSKMVPDYIAPMFHTNTGQILLTIAVILEIIGFFWIYKIVNVKI